MDVILYNIAKDLREGIWVLIKELSLITGASIRSLRHYEFKGLLHSSRLDNGYRDYNEQAVEIVKVIQLYLSLGLTTDNIAQIIDCPTLPGNDRPLCKEAHRLYKAKLEEINKQLDILHTIRIQLQDRIKEFE